MGWVYLIRNGDLHKIGRTDNLERRLKQLQPGEVVQVLETDRSRDLEHELHQRFKEKRLPQTEYFRLDEAEVNAARMELGWDPSAPVILPPTPLDNAIKDARSGARLALGCVAATTAAFLGETVAMGHWAVLDVVVGFLELATLVAFVLATVALLATSAHYGRLLLWRQIKAKREVSI